MTMHAACGSAEAAHPTPLVMPNAVSQSWNAMTAAMAKHGHTRPKKPTDLFDQMGSRRCGHGREHGGPPPVAVLEPSFEFEDTWGVHHSGDLILKASGV
ncbi:hypothetical protein OPV22_033509 [Ensete ventricosum]|uniref:VAN3-binding protein-like auxin canalisation domain-containing protein n=1 Tax=Ensete ventricosum TaxID=4639 RepID=A0AAV8PUH0_ENSVE|nr:hypothetical protein OPV22_033509 [Ensete ventricosum]